MDGILQRGQLTAANVSDEVGARSSRPTYIDIFAGCGGLSLGLHKAGWQGLFAVEKDENAFSTLSENFLSSGSRYPYQWPDWLEKKPWTAEDLIGEHLSDLRALRGKIDLLAGGPPCQGFSTAGQRRADDPRNSMVERYLDLVAILEPKVLLLENVRGFTMDFKSKAGRSAGNKENAASQLIRRLSADFHVESRIVMASEFGIPQNRPRFLLVAVRRNCGLAAEVLENLHESRDRVLGRYDLTASATASDAISDLEISGNDLISSPDSPGFEAIGYRCPLTPYQRAMRDGSNSPPSDTRLAKHTAQIRERFADIIEMCASEGHSSRGLSPEMRDRFGLKKLTTRVLDPLKPSPTVTSMPDDLLHYSEPRTLTVRENARLQSFPDWFTFHGKYTSGGLRRRHEVPRFTQVANAVPPLLAEIMGECIRRHCLGLE